MKFVIVFLILSSRLTWAGMVSLDEYYLKNPKLGNNELYYISNRCSALMYHLFSLNETPLDLKEFLKKSQIEFANLSLSIKKNSEPDLPDKKNLEETSNDIDLIIDDYINSSNDHFYETGTYINPGIWKDLDSCSQILQQEKSD